MKNLSKKEVESLLNIVSNYYDVEQFDNKNSYAYKLYSKLEDIKNNLKIMSEKILVSDSAFLECVDEMATQITELKFGKETYLELKNDLDNHVTIFFSDKAKDFYNDKFNEYETLINNTLNVWNKQREL